MSNVSPVEGVWLGINALGVILSGGLFLLSWRRWREASRSPAGGLVRMNGMRHLIVQAMLLLGILLFSGIGVVSGLTPEPTRDVNSSGRDVSAILLILADFLIIGAQAAESLFQWILRERAVYDTREARLRMAAASPVTAAILMPDHLEDPPLPGDARRESPSSGPPWDEGGLT